MRICLTVVFALLLMASGAQAQGEIVPDGWKNVDACSITLQIPSEARLSNALGFDSCVKVFAGNDIYIMINVTLGYTENDMKKFRTEHASKSTFNLSETAIDGNGALTKTFYESDTKGATKGFHYASAMFVPEVKNFEGSILIWVYTRNPDGHSIARQIFESIRFVTNDAASNNSFNRTRN
jgi:hypothetical protein